MLYHVSPIGGLEILEPRMSSHGRAYVYAVDDLVTGLLFGAPHDDLDFLLDVDAEGRPELYECYPDAFQTIYGGKRCFVYEVPEEGFQRGMTAWEPELVCGHPVKVRREIAVPDLLHRLLEEEGNRRLIIHRYDNIIAYKKIISEHLVDRLIRFQMIDVPDRRCETYYAGLIEGIKGVMDGHLL